MAPRRTNNNDLPLNDWEELRRTLREMQEGIQETIHSSMREFSETVLQHLQYDHDRRHFLDEDGSTEGEDNPFAEEGHRQHQRRNLPNRAREDRSWEMGFKVEIPEFH